MHSTDILFGSWQVGRVVSVAIFIMKALGGVSYIEVSLKIAHQCKLDASKNENLLPKPQQT